MSMDETRLRTLLEDLTKGHSDIDQVVAAMRHLPFEDAGDARIDHHRALRCGASEVIFCQNKTVEQVRTIFATLAAHQADQNVLATRATPAMGLAVAADFPEAVYHESARAILLRRDPSEPVGHIAVVSAGTSDLPVAEEARLTAESLGARVTSHYDVGVAGLHRLLAECEQLQRARVVVAVAGMEGALASVVGGLVAVPVIAVPTSVGYGASFGGIAALLAMLNSCASGVTVVNIDNGFGAGYAAAMINRLGQTTGETTP